MKKYFNPEIKFFDVVDQDVLTLSTIADVGHAIEIDYSEFFPKV